MASDGSSVTELMTDEARPKTQVNPITLAILTYRMTSLRPLSWREELEELVLPAQLWRARRLVFWMLAMVLEKRTQFTRKMSRMGAPKANMAASGFWIQQLKERPPIVDQELPLLVSEVFVNKASSSATRPEALLSVSTLSAVVVVVVIIIIVIVVVVVVVVPSIGQLVTL